MSYSKIITATAVVLLFVLGLSACKKDKELPTYSIIGLWIGDQSNEKAKGQYYAFSIKPDSTITVEGIAQGVRHYATGTWRLKDAHFVGQIRTIYGIYTNIGVDQTLTASYNSQTRELTSGKWVNTYLKNDSGVFNVKFVK